MCFKSTSLCCWKSHTLLKETTVRFASGNVFDIFDFDIFDFDIFDFDIIVFPFKVGKSSLIRQLPTIANKAM